MREYWPLIPRPLNIEALLKKIIGTQDRIEIKVLEGWSIMNFVVPYYCFPPIKDAILGWCHIITGLYKKFGLAGNTLSSRISLLGI